VTDRWRVTYYLRSGQTVVVYSSTEPMVHPDLDVEFLTLDEGVQLQLDVDSMIAGVHVEPTKAPATSRRTAEGKVDVSSELFAALEQEGAPIGQQRAQQLVKCGRGALMRAIEKLEADGVLRRTSVGLELIEPPDPGEAVSTHPLPRSDEQEQRLQANEVSAVLPPTPPILGNGRVPATPIPGPPDPGPRLEDSEPAPHYTEVPVPQIGES
jgi:hypothetical protein